MKYIWQLICLFCWISAAVCHAETQAGEIKNAEFIIEKQKKNKINQEQRLFFRAPTQAPKNIHKPFAEIQNLTPENLPFDPAPETHFPFSSGKPSMIIPFNHYCRLGISMPLWFPYIDLSLHHLPFLQGIWSTNIAYIPELLDKRSREAFLGFKGKYGIGSWLFEPKVNYTFATNVKYLTADGQTDRNNQYRGTDPTHKRTLHQGNGRLLVTQSSESSTQDGKISYNLLAYHHEKIREQLLTVKYKWVKQLDNISLSIRTHNDVAWYTNKDTSNKTRTIFSVTPSLTFTLPKDTQLKADVRVAYYNDPINGIPPCDLYPMIKISHAVTSWLNPYVGIGGMGCSSAQLLHLHKVVAKNPFIAGNCELLPNYQHLKLHGGSKGMISTKWTYHLDITYRQRKNLSKMLRMDDKITYTLRYNPEKHSVLKATGLIHHVTSSTKFNTTIQGTYYKNFENKSAPIWWYNKPRYKLKSMVSYKLHPKSLLTGSLYWHEDIIGKDVNGNIFKEKRTFPNISLTLGGDYFFSKRLAAFVMISLLRRKNASYIDYIGKGTNITAGIQYKW